MESNFDAHYRDSLQEKKSREVFRELAANNLMKEVNKLGLEYVDDYFLIEGDFPEWLSLRGELKVE